MNLENVRIPRRSDYSYVAQDVKEEEDAASKDGVKKLLDFGLQPGMQTFFVTPFKIVLYVVMKEYFEMVEKRVCSEDSRMILFFLGYMEVRIVYPP